MTPKEKASELFNKMINLDSCYQGVDLAKEASLITVINIIEALHMHQWQNRNEINYWQEVMQEIYNI